VADCCPTCDQRDLTGRRGARFVLWQLPLLVFLAGIFVRPSWRIVLWTAALVVAGAACVANAARCGRLHCYFTGPFYLIAALVTLTYGLGLLPLGAGRWGWIGAGVAVGSFLFACVPERIWGTYVTRGRPARG
jgi:hypothetical protein